MSFLAAMERELEEKRKSACRRAASLSVDMDEYELTCAMFGCKADWDIWYASEKKVTPEETTAE